VTGNGSGQWVTARHCISNLAGQSNVLFRFTFCSGTTCNAFDGIAIDSIFIGDVPKPITTITYTCEGNNTLKFDGASDGCIATWVWDFGDPASGMANASIGQSASHQFSAPGTFNVSLLTTQPCSGTDTTVQQIGIQNFNLYTSSVTCIGDADGTAQVDVSNFANPSVLWSTIPAQTTDSIGGLAVGNYVVTVTDPAFCPVQKTAIIQYGPDANISVNLGPDQRLCSGTTIVLDAGNYFSLQWQDGSVKSQYPVDQTGLYYVDVANISGCTASDTIVIFPGCGDNVWVPDAFTPNDDATNEKFIAYGVGVETIVLEVYNRMGQLIFSSVDEPSGWDGTYRKQQAPEGVYGYSVRYSLFDGTSHTKRGIVALLR
jgi:gliding motility-associated-like protein